MSACRKCGGQIAWKREGARWKPTAPEGGPHICAGAAPRTEAGKTITGANYVPSCGECSTPPWEVCACSARLAA